MANKGMTPIVKVISGWVKSFIMLFGIYIVLFGHLTPGGGFAGGVIIAMVYVLITLAEGKEDALRRMRMGVAAELDSVGALMFLIIALLGVSAGFGGRFFANYIHRLSPGKEFSLFSAGTIPLYNIAIALKVATSLFLVFILLVLLKVIHGPEGEAQ